MWSLSSAKRKGEQAREEDDSSADRRPEGGKRGERARREDNGSVDRLRRPGLNLRGNRAASKL